MKPAWDSLMREYEGHPSVLVGDVCPSYSFMRESQAGFIDLQCPHQGARNLTKEFFPDSKTSLWKLSADSSMAPADAATSDRTKARDIVGGGHAAGAAKSSGSRAPRKAVANNLALGRACRMRAARLASEDCALHSML